MSRKKLTLSVEETAIRRARRYSERHHTSISELVSRFLHGLEAATERTEAPIVDSLRGLVPDDTEVAEYEEYLSRKYDAE